MQHNNLEVILTEVKEYMDKKDYNTALYKANQLYYTPKDTSKEEKQIKEKWDKIRKSTIKMIEKEAKAEGKKTKGKNTAVIFKGGGLFLSIIFTIKNTNTQLHKKVILDFLCNAQVPSGCKAPPQGAHCAASIKHYNL